MRTLVFVALIATSLMSRLEAATEQDYQKMEYCDLVKNPRVYDGKRVSITATYRYGFEWQEIYCLRCRDGAKTWLQFPSDRSNEIVRALRGIPKGQGTLNATLRGVFRAVPGSFGDGGYKFQLDLEGIGDVQVVSRNGGIPEALNSSEKQKLCQ